MDQKEAVEDELSAINKELKEIKERILPRIMEDAEITQYRVAGAGTISIRQELFVSMTAAGDDPEGERPFYEWAREHAPDLIKPYIHPGRLKSYCKESLENGVALPDNMIKATFVPTATLLRRG